MVKHCGAVLGDQREEKYCWILNTAMSFRFGVKLCAFFMLCWAQLLGRSTEPTSRMKMKPQWVAHLL